jgi:hypothetical protein
VRGTSITFRNRFAQDSLWHQYIGRKLFQFYARLRNAGMLITGGGGWKRGEITSRGRESGARAVKRIFRRDEDVFLTG